jgi:uncharacterized protein
MRTSTRTAAVIALLAGAAAGFFVVGALLYKTAIDLDSPAFLLGAWIQATLDALGLSGMRGAAGPVWIGITLLAVLVGSFLFVRAASQARAARVDPERRSLLTGAAAGAGAALGATVLAAASGFARAFYGLGNQGRGFGPVLTEIFAAEVAKTHPEHLERWYGARIRAHRRLGRTDWPVSDVALGSSRISAEKGEEIVRLAIERGVNYIDTAPDYVAAGSETAIGRALRGQRDKIFLSTKFCTPRGHLRAGASVSEYMVVVEESLRRLSTDYVDLVHVHSCDEVERLMGENMHEAFDRLRAQGKARFLGFSSHTPRLVEVAERAIESGRFDVMMLAYHHGIWPELPDVITRARHEQDMGVVAMKTLKGAKHHGLAGFRERAGAYSQAALSWVLSNPDVSAAVISFFELQHVDEYLHASGRSLEGSDLTILDAYDRAIQGSYCAPHCGSCLSLCPEGLPIHDVLRHRMYFEDYGHEREAMRLYAALEKGAVACATCPAPCAGACPIGVPIRERMMGAHDLLTLG